MDQMNLLPNNPRRLASEGNPLQVSPSVMGHHYVSHMATMSAWHQPLPLNEIYFTHSTGFVQPSHLGQHGSLPHPDRSLRALQTVDSVAGLPADPIYWSAALQPTSSMAVSMSNSSMSMDNSGASSSSGFSVAGEGIENANAGARGLALQPPAAVDWAPSGATSDAHAITSSLFSFSTRLANVSEQPSASSALKGLNARSHTDIIANLFGYRDITGLPSPTSERRRQAYSRGRRTMASRQSESDPPRPQEETSQDAAGDNATASPRPIRRASLTDDMIARQMQMFRGAVSSKLVASKAAIQSLQSIDVSALPENEKTCVICYNDYGVASPEGVNEAPLRIPSCKHIFGDHCIKKWLEDSDSCPYCRSKLQSEPKHTYGSARTFLNMMRMRGLPLPAGLSEEVITRLTSRPVTDHDLQELFAQSARTADRRSPPDDATGQDQRRTRQRRSGPASEFRFAELRAAQVRPAPESSSYPGPQDLPPDLMPRNMPWNRHATAIQERAQPRLAANDASAHFMGLNEQRPAAEHANLARTRYPAPDPTAPVIVHGSTVREPRAPNPLHTASIEPHVGNIATPSLTAAMQPSSPPNLGTSNQRPAEPEPPHLRPSRNRPW
ncbi:hypothetical protein QQS21_012237 [Conoideocrella luteorostrata]|uniref:RING-type domain-containing protein n=1 Tax=Conoideocrella luteorostrata TaxID=1105319 RepID=A0AAJ0FSM2_9HYPO|nr:hypothetical protein QQS21_012237 [Conoideocrella luteorostrata]